MSCYKRGKAICIGTNIAQSHKKGVNQMRKFLNVLRDDKGASAVEYGLLVALIAAVIVGAVTLFGTRLNETFNYIANLLPIGGGSP